MIVFVKSYYLWLMLCLPLLAVFYLLVHRLRKRAIARLGHPDSVSRMMAKSKPWKRKIGYFLKGLGIAFLVFALANPKFGSSKKRIERKGVDLVIALDVSRSMMAEDLLPNRLERSKQLIEKILEAMPNHRMGLVVFAGSAYPQLPLTLDHGAMRTILDVVGAESAGTQGTSIKNALVLSNKILNRGKADKSSGGKAILLISDGEEQEGGATDQAKLLGDSEIKIYTVGVGSTEGAPIPDGKGGFMKEGTAQASSRLHEKVLKELAASTGGTYTRFSGVRGLVESLETQLEKIRQTASEEYVYTAFKSRFQWFIILSILCLLIDMLLSKTWRKKRIRI